MNLSEGISAILPVRNEEANVERAVASLAAQPEIRQIIVVDDQSTDGTAAILKRLAAQEPRVQVHEAGSLPPGWVGKNHAVWLGSQHATEPWLLFTDADAVHLPGSAARALADAAASNAVLVSYSPAQEMHTWWERALIPFVFCRLAQLYSFASVNDPESRAAAANGQYLLVRREAYDAIGGHAAVSGEVLEDVALAQRAKAAKMRLFFAPGPEIARVRMYSSFRAMWEGWTKNLLPLLKTPGQTVSWELLWVIPWIPALLFLGTPINIGFAVAAIALLAGRHASYAGQLRRNRFPRSDVIYYLPGVVLYGCVLLSSDWQYARGKVVWKGRKYPVGNSGT